MLMVGGFLVSLWLVVLGLGVVWLFVVVLS